MGLASTAGYLVDKLNLNKFRKLYYYQDGVKKSIDIGAFQEQKFESSNTITENPVEFGANLSDSIYKNADIIQIAIIVGDSTGLIASVVNSVASITNNLTNDIMSGLQETAFNIIDGNATGNYRSSKVYNEIIKVKENFLPVEIITRDRIYTNLQIQNINRVIDLENYGGAVIIVDLKSLLVFGTEENNSLLQNPKQNGFMLVKEISDSILEVFN